MQKMRMPQEAQTVKKVLVATAATAGATLLFKGLVAGGDVEDSVVVVEPAPAVPISAASVEYERSVLEAQPGPSTPQELSVDVIDFPESGRYVRQDPTQLNVTKQLYTSNLVKHAKLEVASYVQQISEDITRQRALERPESFLAEVEVLMPYKRKVLYYQPALPAKDLALLVETYPGIDF